jgi:hypothetical protein
MAEREMTNLQKEVAFYGDSLSSIAGPKFSLVEYCYGDRLPHAWKIIRLGESPEQLAIIELVGSDLLAMAQMSDVAKHRYLRERFEGYFAGL